MNKKRMLPAVLLLCVLCLLSGQRAVPVFAPPGSTVELPVLMYHSLVTDDARASEYVCPISRLENDLKWLRAHGYESVSPAQLTAFARGEGTLPPKPVLLTLDDGYRNNLTLLPPLLEAYDFHAVIAVVGEYADRYTASGDDGSLHTCMSWEDTRQAASLPRITLACHSYYFHHIGSRMGAAKKQGERTADWQAAFRADTDAMVNAMTARCGVTPLCYAYPYGQIAEGADAILADLGFQITLSCYEKRSVLQSGDPGCLFSLGRFNRDGRLDTETFMKTMLGI